MTKSGQLETHDLRNIAYFDRWAKSYESERISPWFQYTQKLSISLFDLRPDSRVLDVGCGPGFAVRYLAGMLPEGKACGIDISPGMIEKANAKVPDALRKRLEFRQGKSDAIPYPAEEFDYVLCTNSFHHYPDPIKALKEMQRVLKPGGQIVIFENATDLSWYTWLWDRYLRLREKGHVKYYTSKEMGEILRRSGLENVQLCHLRNERFKYGKIFASIQVWKGQKPAKVSDGPQDASNTGGRR